MTKKVTKDENGNDVVEQFNDTKPGDPGRVAEEQVLEPAYRTPVVKEHDPLGTTDGEEPRVVADDLLKEIQRPVKRSALNPNSDNKDALIGDEDEDVEEDHDSRIVTQDPRKDVPEVEGVRVVQVDEEVVAPDASHVAGQSDEEKAFNAQVLRPTEV